MRGNTMGVPTIDSADSKPDKKSDDTLGDTLQLVKDYARQETLGPLRGWVRYLGFGSAGAVVLGIGLVVAAVGVLRLLQTETTAFSGPATSVLAYLITLAACVVIIGVVGWQISRRRSLQREEDPS